MDAQDTIFYRKFSLSAHGKRLEIGLPVVMGIVNTTPDSFFGDSRAAGVEQALQQCEKHIHQGATFLDIGGYSTRPGAPYVTQEEEMKRLLPILQAVRKHFPNTWLSVDTFRSNVAKAAWEAGADVINDVSGGTLDKEMFSFVAQQDCPYVLMHMRGTPQTMQSFNQYQDVTQDVLAELGVQLSLLQQQGARQVIIDPGFGFAKDLHQNYTLLKELGALQQLKVPILAGVSRKGMVYKPLQITADEALNGTTVIHTLLLMNGAQVLRVHDVKPAMEAIRLVNLYRNVSE